jgi:hypothetical protein
MLRKKIKMNAARQGAVVNLDGQCEPVPLAPCVLILRKFPDKSDGHDVLDPSAVMKLLSVHLGEKTGIDFE